MFTTFLNLLSFGDAKTTAAYTVFYQMATAGWLTILIYIVYQKYVIGSYLPLDFDNEITKESLIKTLVAYLAIIATAIFASSFGGMQVVGWSGLSIAVLFYIPRPTPADLSTITDVLGSKSVAEFLRQNFVVAHGEEILRVCGGLVLSSVFYANMRMRRTLLMAGGKPVTLGVVLALGVTNALWTAFHAMRATSSTTALIGIFLCGIILSWHLLSTHCVLLTILAHGLYNYTVLVLQGGI